MTTTTHLISVIIPVYNVKHYLRQCLDSVVSQTYRNIEILIIDDGSSDGSGIICDDYALKDARVKVFHTDNLGLSAARNYGLDHKSEASEYVVFLDSDDWMEPQAIQILFNSADKYQADIVSCSFYIEYLNCQLTSSQPELKMVLEGEQSLNSFISEFYIGNAAWNKLYKAELFKSLRYPQGRLYEDVSTTYKTVLAAERVVVLPDLLIHYRIRKRVFHTHIL